LKGILQQEKPAREKKMTQSNEINGIIDGIGDLLFVIDKDRVIVRVNKATCVAKYAANKLLFFSS